MDIADWLRRLELPQYIPAFAENAIDWAVLPRLTADDLRDIGIVAVGHRRKLLDAIAAPTRQIRPRQGPRASRRPHRRLLPAPSGAS